MLGALRLYESLWSRVRGSPLYVASVLVAPGEGIYHSFSINGTKQLELDVIVNVLGLFVFVHFLSIHLMFCLFICFREGMRGWGGEGRGLG